MFNLEVYQMMLLYTIETFSFQEWECLITSNHFDIYTKIKQRQYHALEDQTKAATQQTAMEHQDSLCFSQELPVRDADWL